MVYNRFSFLLLSNFGRKGKFFIQRGALDVSCRLR